MNIDQVVLNTKTIIRSSILSLLQILNHQSQKNASEVQNQKINNLVENIITEVKQIANTHEEQKESTKTIVGIVVESPPSYQAGGCAYSHFYVNCIPYINSEDSVYLIYSDKTVEKYNYRTDNDNYRRKTGKLLPNSFGVYYWECHNKILLSDELYQIIDKLGFSTRPAVDDKYTYMNTPITYEKVMKYEEIYKIAHK